MQIFDDRELIFCFGSNLAGRHGQGAARDARERYGAICGQGEGRQGRSYAIPTKDEALHALPLRAIACHVEGFLAHARECPAERFQVTRIGCGRAGYQDDEIAPLFAQAPDNVLLPGRWELYRRGAVQRVIVAGSRDFDDEVFLSERLEHLLSRAPKGSEIVSGRARGADRLGEEWARSRGWAITAFPAHWNHFGKRAGFIRNTLMAWYGTHLVAFWDGRSPGTRAMIELARESGLATRVCRYGAPALTSRTNR